MARNAEVVRTQLDATIRRKQGLSRRLERQSDQLAGDLAALNARRAAIDAEIGELVEYLAALGGPVEKPKKAKSVK